MPLVQPTPEETRGDFIERCLSDPKMIEEFEDNSQRAAVCSKLWEEQNKTENFVKVIKADQVHKIVKGVVYEPFDIDTDGETMSADDVRNAAWDFIATGKQNKIDIQHDWKESGCYVVESYIAEDGDPLFPKDSWVLGVKCTDDIFGRVLKGELNGFSFGGSVRKFSQRVLLEVAKQVVGETYENMDKGLIPAHSHNFIILYNKDGRIEKGVTDVVFDHQHTITYGTATDNELGHSHRVSIEDED